MHELHDPAEHIRVGVRRHAVAEVEDVAGRSGAGPQHPTYAVGEHGPRRAEQRGVEIALHRVRRTDPGRCLGQRQPPVDPDHVRTGGRHRPEQLAGADPEVDGRHAEPADALQHGGRVRLDVAQVVLGAQRPGPGVEQLDGSGTGGHLHLQEGAGQFGEPPTQLVPEVGPGDHQRLGPGVVPARSALDQIAGQRERCAGETDQRDGPQLGHGEPDRLGDEAQLTGRRSPELIEVGSGPDRSLDHRPGAGDDLDADSGGRQRNHDVGVEHGGVDPVPADRLQRDLGDQLGPAAAVQHRHAPSQRPVLRQRAARLAHEPDRYLVVEMSLPAGSEEHGRRLLPVGTEMPRRPDGTARSELTSRRRPPPSSRSSSSPTASDPPARRAAVAGQLKTTLVGWERNRTLHQHRPPSGVL